MQPILIEGRWQSSQSTGSFIAHNPATREALPGKFPVSSWADCDRALDAASDAAKVLRTASGEQIAAFLSGYANAIEGSADELVKTAHLETALPIKPRLREVELPRTVTQLRQAAAAANEGSWTQAVLDTKLNIRSHFAPVGPVAVFGPNNFPFAFNGVSGGDFAAAIAVGCPVIAKAHPLHPATSTILARCAVKALQDAGLPAATVQMLYHFSNEDGLRLVADPRLAATGFTGSRTAGLALRAAAERAGNLMYLEMSSLNPVVFLPGALAGRGDALATEAADSGLAASGQFCTSPNLFFLIESEDAHHFIQALTKLYTDRPAAPLLSEAGLNHLRRSIEHLESAGAHLLTGGLPANGATGYGFSNTALQVSGRQFLAHGEALQQEAFGNACTVVLCANGAELDAALSSLEGNLTGSIYSSTDGSDDDLYAPLPPSCAAAWGACSTTRCPPASLLARR